MKFRPRLATTLRPHGKWGDLIVCVIPIGWCANILTNSNTLLKMIEWQNETGLITIRIRGKQWYWVYKYELKTLTDVFTLPKNVGHDKWQITTPGDLEVTDDYLHAVQLRANNKWVKDFWKNKIEEINKADNEYEAFGELINFFNKKKNNFFKTKNYKNNVNPYNDKYSLIDKNPDSKVSHSLEDVKNDIYSSKFQDYVEISRWNRRSYGSNDFVRVIKYPISNKSNFNFNSEIIELFNLRFNFNESTIQDRPVNNYIYFTFKQKRYVRKAEVKPTSHTIRINGGIRQPASTPKDEIVYKRRNFLKLFLNKEYGKKKTKTFFNKKSLIMKPEYYDPNKTLMKNFARDWRYVWVHEPELLAEGGEDAYHIAFAKIFVKHCEEILKIRKKEKRDGRPYSGWVVVKDHEAIISQYKTLKMNRNRSENQNLILSKRLLRVKRTVVLPAHINITAITNSFDVVHSWFVPGLGLKMDCIPGRATHHTFFIDNVGFYYGQCAEICGRYHHHMPVRICALPYEHFLIWWNYFGVKKFMRHKSFFKKHRLHIGNRKFVF